MEVFARMADRRCIAVTSLADVLEWEPWVLKLCGEKGFVAVQVAVTDRRNDIVGTKPFAIVLKDQLIPQEAVMDQIRLQEVAMSRDV
jgi:hypothetical protein